MPDRVTRAGECVCMDMFTTRLGELQIPEHGPVDTQSPACGGGMVCMALRMPSCRPAIVKQSLMRFVLANRRTSAMGDAWWHYHGVYWRVDPKKKELCRPSRSQYGWDTRGTIQVCTFGRACPLAAWVPAWARHAGCAWFMVELPQQDTP